MIIFIMSVRKCPISRFDGQAPLYNGRHRVPIFQGGLIRLYAVYVSRMLLSALLMAICTLGQGLPAFSLSSIATALWEATVPSFSRDAHVPEPSVGHLLPVRCQLCPGNFGGGFQIVYELRLCPKSVMRDSSGVVFNGRYWEIRSLFVCSTTYYWFCHARRAANM